ncbi:MAG: hypothetical protein TU36_007325 [Vulcanisaeta sp. AZ3]|jgi:hypothetical protein
MLTVVFSITKVIRRSRDLSTNPRLELTMNDESSSIPEIPGELRSVLETVSEGNTVHIKCRYRGRDGRECGVLFFSLKDAIRHLITHDDKYRRFLQLIERA